MNISPVPELFGIFRCRPTEHRAQSNYNRIRFWTVEFLIFIQNTLNSFVVRTGLDKYTAFFSAKKRTRTP